MLVLTETAATAIRSVVDANQLPDSAGLRITAEPESPEGTATLAVQIVEAPEAEDDVVESAGARVFLDAEASGHLDDKVLDAEIDEVGSIRFGLGEQRPVDGM